MVSSIRASRLDRCQLDLALACVPPGEGGLSSRNRLESRNRIEKGRVTA